MLKLLRNFNIFFMLQKLSQAKYSQKKFDIAMSQSRYGLSYIFVVEFTNSFSPFFFDNFPKDLFGIRLKNFDQNSLENFFIELLNRKNIIDNLVYLAFDGIKFEEKNLLIFTKILPILNLKIIDLSLLENDKITLEFLNILNQEKIFHMLSSGNDEQNLEYHTINQLQNLKVICDESFIKKVLPQFNKATDYSIRANFYELFDFNSSQDQKINENIEMKPLEIFENYNSSSNFLPHNFGYHQALDFYSYMPVERLKLLTNAKN